MVYANPNDIKVGNYYNYTFNKNSIEYEMTEKTGHLIKITGIRGKTIFYTLAEYPGFKEQNFDIGSYMSLHLEPLNSINKL